MEDSSTLSSLNRKHLIAGLIGEHEYLCHDHAEDTDMTPAEHYPKLITHSDAELIEDSDLIDSPYNNAENIYDAYCPSEIGSSSLCPN